MKNETKSKNNIIKSFHSFSLPPEKIEAYKKAPSEILMNFIQEEELEEEKVKEGDLDKELKKESKEESKQNYENVDCKKENKDEYSVKENKKEFNIKKTLFGWLDKVNSFKLIDLTRLC
jgi:hypothetical protein